MKRNILYLSLLTLISACATSHRVVTKEVPIMPVRVPGTTVPSAEYDTLRNGEVIKQYYAGAYVDPNNPNVRHNPHNVQRVEQTATWNLRPNVPVVAGGPTYVAAASAAQNSALTAQLSGQLDRQKGYTDALTAQNEKLQEIIQKLKEASDQDAQARAATEAELRLTLETIKSLKEEIQKAPQQQAPTPLPSITPKPKGSLLDNMFRGSETGQLIMPKGRPEESPRVKALLDTLDLHIAALDSNHQKETATNPDDNIDLDSISDPLRPKVAQAKASK
jgi:hypothetical protein